VLFWLDEVWVALLFLLFFLGAICSVECERRIALITDIRRSLWIVNIEWREARTFIVRKRTTGSTRLCETDVSIRPESVEEKHFYECIFFVYPKLSSSGGHKATSSSDVITIHSSDDKQERCILCAIVGYVRISSISNWQRRGDSVDHCQDTLALQF
jgi:hypothetical protein